MSERKCSWGRCAVVSISGAAMLLLVINAVLFSPVQAAAVYIPDYPSDSIMTRALVESDDPEALGGWWSSIVESEGALAGIMQWGPGGALISGVICPTIWPECETLDAEWLFLDIYVGDDDVAYLIRAWRVDRGVQEWIHVMQWNEYLQAATIRLKDGTRVLLMFEDAELVVAPR